MFQKLLKGLLAVNDLRILWQITAEKPFPEQPADSGVFFLESDYREAATIQPFPLKRDSVFSTSRGAIGCLTALILILGFVSASLWGLVDEDFRLNQAGIETDAQVIECKLEHSQRPSLTYAYRVINPDGRPVELIDRVSGGYFQFCVPAGSTIQIEYLAADPSITRPSEPGLASQSANQSLFIVVSLPALLLLGIFAILLRRHLRDSWRYRQLRDRGVLLPGRIAQAARRPGSGPTRLEIGYEFTAPTGKMLGGTQSRARLRSDGAWLPPPGTPCCILYVNDRLFILC